MNINIPKTLYAVLLEDANKRNMSIARLVITLLAEHYNVAV